MTNTMNADERRKAWNEALFSSETDSWDYGQWLSEIIENKFSAIEAIFGEENSREILFELVRKSAVDEGENPMNWRDAIEAIGVNALTSWRISKVFYGLGLYGRYGVTLENIELDKRESYIENLLLEGETFVANYDYDHGAGQNNPLRKIAGLARSRWNLDHLSGEVDPLSLSILGGLSEGRIRNMMSGNKREFENTGGQISALSALGWLKSRSAFFPSIWHEHEKMEENTDFELLSDVVFVPKASDGSFFSPDLIRSGKYTIGAKGCEEKIGSYDEALHMLQKMGVEARWRRPNSADNWGIVKVDKWIPIDRASLSALGNF